MEIQPRALMKLVQISRITDIEQLRLPPSNHLEALSGSLKGCWSIRVDMQWRVVFRWESGNARDVRILDYH
ncbi:type II toxin-antitoxin system RelE/ParE family toxin [Luteolibacter sp. Populi]|uniref:type II toxin-antitoxin system RelE/ParE family toxin n=1 Tax=Luteolibacter sp. Populi TaxID=3230487 RepID=UPI003466BA86